MNYTHVDHNIRHGLGFSANDYYVCDLIYRSQNREGFSLDGWCTLSYASMANTLKTSVLSCKNSVKKLSRLAIILDNGRKKRVTNIWSFIQETVYEIYQTEIKDGIGSIPDLVYKIYCEWYINYTENGIESVPHNIISKFKLNLNYPNKEKKGGDENTFSFKNSITNSAPEKKDASPKKKVPPKKKGVISVPLFLFDDTALTDLDYFVAKFTDTDYQFADLEYYRSRLRTWGNDNNVKLSESKWLDTAKMFMRRDTEKGNLIRKPELNQYNNGRSKQIINPEQAFRILNSNQDW